MLEESTTGSNLSRKATLLMAEVLAMANRVLPLTLAAKIQVGSISAHPISYNDIYDPGDSRSFLHGNGLSTW